jgi:hypothetical protein
MESTAHKPQITEAQAERRADIRVDIALRSNRAYQWAENAEAQQEAEEATAAKVWADLEAEFEII